MRICQFLHGYCLGYFSPLAELPNSTRSQVGRAYYKRPFYRPAFKRFMWSKFYVTPYIRTSGFGLTDVLKFFDVHKYLLEVCMRPHSRSNQTEIRYCKSNKSRIIKSKTYIQYIHLFDPHKCVVFEMSLWVRL